MHTWFANKCNVTKVFLNKDNITLEIAKNSEKINL